MKPKNIKFSIVIPTYTGQDHIVDCFDSILAQDNLSEFKFDLIIVIDGPNLKLQETVYSQKSRFIDKKIDFHIFQFKKNKGRFAARLKGARESKNRYVLFLDDRNTLAHDYLTEVLKANKKALMPNVMEDSHPHFIAKTIYLLRKTIYGKNWGRDFSSYEITTDNFEKSSKGTTSFWVERDSFIVACDEISKGHIDLKAINEDTKIMRYLIENGTPIYRSSEAKIYYQPRKYARAELEHIFHRGPRFIDYYLRSGTRFFAPLILFYIATLVSLILVVVAPVILLALVGLWLVMSLLVAYIINDRSVSIVSIFVGLNLVIIYFCLGVLKGSLVKLLQPSKENN